MLNGVAGMTNEEKIQELNRLSNEMRRLLKQGKYKERNALVPKWCELYRSIDFGFEIGDKF